MTRPKTLWYLEGELFVLLLFVVLCCLLLLFVLFCTCLHRMVVCCVLVVACCVLLVACCLLRVVCSCCCCLLSVACCLLFGVCCVFCVVCWCYWCCCQVVPVILCIVAFGVWMRGVCLLVGWLAGVVLCIVHVCACLLSLYSKSNNNRNKLTPETINKSLRLPLKKATVGNVSIIIPFHIRHVSPDSTNLCFGLCRCSVCASFACF